MNTRSAINIRSRRDAQRQRGWGAVAAAARIVAAERAGGFRWMRACVRPRHRATSVRLTGLCCTMTRLCCSCDKDKLQRLENISTFFFLTLPIPTPSFFFLFFPGIGWIPNASHTKGIWWRRVGASLSEIILGCKKLLLTIYGSGAGFNQRKCLWLLHFHKQTGNTSLTNWLLKNLSDKFWFRHVTVQVSITDVMFALPLNLTALCRKRRRKNLSGLKVG